MANENNKIKLLLLWDILSNIKNNGLCCFVNRFLRDFKKFSKLFLFSGF